MRKCYKALLVFLICPLKDLAEDAIVSSILEYIVGTLAHRADHLLKSSWIRKQIICRV